MSYSSASSLHASPILFDDSRPRRPRGLSPTGSFTRSLHPKQPFTSSSMPFSQLAPTSAVSIPSSRTSPASTPSQFGTNGSLQSTPEGIVPINFPSLPPVTSLSLPDSLLPPPFNPPTSSPSAMSEVFSKGPGLIRRVSRGAQGIPNKFRRNGSNAHREASSGPIIMRRRSDSRTAADGPDVSDLDLDFEDEEAIEDIADLPREPINALGISSSRPSVSSLAEPAVAPRRNPRLEQGIRMTKISDGKRKDVTMRLNLDSAKVFWDNARPSKAFYLDDVKEIRSGPNAKNYREQFGFGEEYEPFWFTVIYNDSSRSKSRQKTMHLVAPDRSAFDLWTHSLESVSRSRIDLMAGLRGFAEKSAKLVWRQAMNKKFDGAEHSEEEESLDLVGTVALCRSLHINTTENVIRAHFEKADRNNTKTLNQAQFLYFVRRLKERKDIKAIFKQIAGPRDEIDRETFFAFLEEVQGEDVQSNLQQWTTIFEKCSRTPKAKATATPSDGGEIPLPAGMSFAGFQSFLTSSSNDVFASAPAEPLLDRPLNEYFVSSSHNTYLLGRQVAGESSTEAYVNALQKGCRCIEIDCWDGSDGKPIVMHGRTLTKSIPFLDTIKCIDKYAFCESEYPLIISLEVHCNDRQQQIMTQMMQAEFGDKLLQLPVNAESHTLPSPEELKGKILIKVKAAAEDLDVRAVSNELAVSGRQRSFSSPWSRPRQLDDTIIPNSPLVYSPPSMSPPERINTFWASPRASTTSTNATTITPILVSSAEDSDSPNVTQTEDKKRRKPKTSNIVKVLGDLGVYTRGIKYQSFDDADAHTHNHVFSFGERTFDKLCKPGAETKQQLEEHNMRSLMRVYPAGIRVNSSNFEPIKFWRRGVQMAALNWQTYDLGQQINEAMFAAGADRTGYVLKPSELRSESPTPVIGHKRAPKKRVRFAVQILSAQQLPRPRGLNPEASVNPYVEFEMYCAEDKGPNATGEGGQDASARHGLSGIGSPLRKRTRVIEGNGYNPEFQDRITMNLTTRYPSLVFVRWTVWNSLDGRNTAGGSPLATFTAKLSSLQQGYRHLPLYDSNGEQYLFSSLFCRIEKEDLSDICEAIPERSSYVEPAEPSTSRAIFSRILRRSPSERKKRKEEQAKETDSGFFSRSSTLER